MIWSNSITRDISPDSGSPIYSFHMLDGTSFNPSGDPIAVCTSEDLEKNFSYYSQSSFNLGLFPPAIRYISPSKRLITWERPPSYVHASFTSKYKDSISNGAPLKNLKIPIPWHLYFVTLSPTYEIDRVYLFFTTDSISSWNSPIYVPPLHNLYEDCKVCLPSWSSDFENASDLFDLMQIVYSITWHSGFNMDLRDCVSRYSDPSWAESLMNPLSDYLSYDPERVGSSHYYSKWSRIPFDDIVHSQWIPYSTFGEFIDDYLSSESIQSSYSAFLTSMVFAAQDSSILV